MLCTVINVHLEVGSGTKSRLKTLSRKWRSFLEGGYTSDCDSSPFEPDMPAPGVQI